MASDLVVENVSTLEKLNWRIQDCCDLSLVPREVLLLGAIRMLDHVEIAHDQINVITSVLE